MLLLLFSLAWFLRTWFAWSLAAPEGLLSGGSDSFYYERIIQHAVETGRHLDYDTGLNYPMGFTNPRPPLFAWFSASVGLLFAPFVGSAGGSVTAVFLLSTAFWGALTIFPTFLLARDAFGKRVGLIAAFMLAVLPAHLQRSPATNGDHDSMVLFFAVTGFYFFFKALEMLKERRWVSSWRDRQAIRNGIRGFLGENRKPLLYSALAGWSIAAIALAWQGWAYAAVILLIYFLVQVIVHRLRGNDPMGILACFLVAVGLPLLVAAPWYVPYRNVPTWYDVPAYLYLAALVFGIVFTVTRDLPWALVAPVTFGVAGLGFLALAIVNPAIANAFVSGAGYFVQTKLYETIAEAQAPGLSQAILSFGMATYYLSLGGLGIMLVYYLTGRDTRPFYLFALVWSFAAIFMSMAAARFIFNAAPAFAITAAFVTGKVLTLLDYDGMKRRFFGVSGNPFSALWKSLKFGHVAGVLLLVFLLIVPNVFYATDAAIPFERKREFDSQLYYQTPEFLRPPGYAATADRGGSFYLGAFGYSLPLTKNYYPTAWNWFATQDQNLSEADRPAYLSWWDYGFEAADEGKHPTVADNFQNGFNLAGNMIAAQGEAEGLAYLSARLIEGDWSAHRPGISPVAGIGPEVRAALEARGIDVDRLSDVFPHASSYAAEILADPGRFGKRDPDLQARNIWYTVIKTELLEKAPGVEAQNEIYRDLRRITGDEIRYFAVDSRLFPTDGQSTGIFYAPMKLSDQRILELSDGRTIPIDFFAITATVGQQDIPIEDLTPEQESQVTGLKIAYKDQFYESMFYRAYVGFRPTQVGSQEDDGIPGYSGSAQSQQAMPGWNLSHWKLVYMTSYYNPWPSAEVQAHRDESVALNYFDAVTLQQEISAGRANGTVFTSPANALTSGVIFLKYYDGATVSGRVTLDGTAPLPGVRVTVSDELDIPHSVVTTDAEGRYTAVAPFGRIKVTASTGTANGRTLVGTVLDSAFIEVSDDAAMRREVDSDSDGTLDYLIDLDLQAEGRGADARVYLDLDHDGRPDDGEPAGSGGVIELAHNESRGLRATFTANEDGRFRAEGLLAGTYQVNVTFGGRRLSVEPVTISASGGADLDIALPAAALLGRLTTDEGEPTPSATVRLEDASTGEVRTTTSRENGLWEFAELLPGSYNLSAATPDLASLRTFIDVDGEQATVNVNLTAYRAARLTGRTTAGGAPQGFVTVLFRRLDDRSVTRTMVSDGNGHYEAAVPIGSYQIYAWHRAGTRAFAYAREVDLSPGALGLDVRMEAATQVEGRAFTGSFLSAMQGTGIRFEGPNAVLTVQTNFGGAYTAVLPAGGYVVSIQGKASGGAEGQPRALLQDLTLSATEPSRYVEFDLGTATLVSGIVFADADENGRFDAGEGIAGARAAFANADGQLVTVTDAGGNFTVSMPPGSFTPSFSKFGYNTHVGVASRAGPLDGRRWPMVPTLVRVAGQVRLDGGPGADLTVVFLRQDGVARPVEASTGPDGRYIADLPPGDYRAEIDEERGDFRVQQRRVVELNVSLADAAKSLHLDAVRRATVGGTVTLEGTGKPATITLTGPDVESVTADSSGAYEVLLAVGGYNVQASLDEDAVLYGALESLEVSGPATLDLALQRTVRVHGRLTHAGAAVLQELEVAFTNDLGATATATTSAFGDYSEDLLAGTYGVSLDAPATATIGGILRHVRYTFSGTLPVPPGTNQITFDLSVDRALDNSTVSGRVTFRGVPVAGRLEFTAEDEGALNASMDVPVGGEYALALAPGNYTVYAVSPAGGVHLGSFDVDPRLAATLDLRLEPALRISGVLLAVEPDGTSRPVAGTVDLDGVGDLSVDTTSGAYQFVVPAGTYGLSGFAALQEREVEITYQSTAAVSLTGDLIRDVRASRFVRRTVAVTWDDAERRTIAGGGTVEYQVSVKNTGNVDDEYTLSATVPGWTFAFSPSRVSADFGGVGASATVSVTAPSDALVDHAALVVTARSEGDSTVRGTVTLQVDVVRVRAVSVTVGTTVPTWDGEFANLTVTIRNRGNAQESFTVSIANPGDLAQLAWQARFLRTPTATAEVRLENVTIAANATTDVTLRLQRLGAAPLPAVALVLAADQADTGSQGIGPVPVAFPRLDEAPTLDVTGAGITAEPPFDFTIWASVVAIVVMGIIGGIVIYREKK